MKTTIISIVAVVATWGCSTTKSSISSEDMRQMKEQSEYLLSIDSSRCMPDLIRFRNMESCYKMVQLNQELRSYRIVFDTILTESYIPNPPFNNRYVTDRDVYDRSKVITNYKVIYRIYDGAERLRTFKIVFYFHRNTATNTLYCNDVRRVPLIPIEDIDF
jgi:hypothetical protein